MRREIGMFVALVLMCLGLYASNQDFLGQSNVLNTTRQISMLGIFSIGIAFVIITGGIDLSIGSVIGLTGVLIAKISASTTQPIVPSRAIAISLALLLLLAYALWVLDKSISKAANLFFIHQIIFACVLSWAWVNFYHLAPVTFWVSAVVILLSLVALAAAHNQARAWLLRGTILVLFLWRLISTCNVAMMGGQPIIVAVVLALIVALSIGYVQGLLISGLKLQPFIVTLGGMLLIRGVSQTIVEGGTISFGVGGFRDLAKNGLFMFHPSPVPPSIVPPVPFPLLPYPLLIFLVVILATAYVLHFTVFGRYVYAIGGNRDAAEYSGINVKRVETATYVISAGLGGVAGICYAAYIGQMSQQVGIAFELYAIAAAVLGGCSLRGGEGTILGVVIGSAVMKVIDNGIIMFKIQSSSGTFRLDTNWTFIIIGAVILIAVILDQIVHIVQQKRRTRRAGELAAARAGEG